MVKPDTAFKIYKKKKTEICIKLYSVSIIKINKPTKLL